MPMSRGYVSSIQLIIFLTLMLFVSVGIIASLP